MNRSFASSAAATTVQWQIHLHLGVLQSVAYIMLQQCGERTSFSQLAYGHERVHRAA